MSEYRQHSYQAPVGATEILLVRHGESRAASADNPSRWLTAMATRATPNGEQQALLVGERLRHEHNRHIRIGYNAPNKPPRL